MTQSQPEESLTLASRMMQRRLEHRQRFDSADYAMKLHQDARPATTASAQAQQAPLTMSMPAGRVKSSVSSLSAARAEPEPEEALTAMTQQYAPIQPGQVPPQSVRRLRLQRFDSADWAMQLHTTDITDTEGAKATSVSSSTHCGAPHGGTVAKLLLDRHAFKTCHFVTTPINAQSQQYVKNA
ncbi:hypothetical protein PINS_up021079 [Pythium insidiosum]|nr:hypothetical protein PINS_up021079 [Pythium insidiosum]